MRALQLKTVNELKDIKGKRVLVRLGLNAAIKNGKVLGGYRIKQVIPTIKLLKAHGARVVAIGHIGRTGRETLKPIAEYIGRRTKIGFVPTLNRRRVEEVVGGMKNVLQKGARWGDRCLMNIRAVLSHS